MSDKPKMTEWERLMADMTAARIAQEEAEHRAAALAQKADHTAQKRFQEFQAINSLPTARGRLTVRRMKAGYNDDSAHGFEVLDAWTPADEDAPGYEVLLHVEVRAVALQADCLHIVDDQVVSLDTVREAVAAVVRHYATRLTKYPDAIPF